MTKLHENESELVNATILLSKTKSYNVDCLHLAIESKSQEFVSHVCVQNIFDKIWDGGTGKTVGLRETLKVIF